MTSALPHRERPLSREIVTLLIVKLIALTVLWYAFFREPVISSMIDGMDPEQVMNAVLRHPVDIHDVNTSKN